MEVEQMMACLLPKIKGEVRNSQAKMDASLKEVKEELMARLEAEIEILRGTLISWIGIYQVRAEANQQGMIAKMDTWIERMEACVGKLEAN
jgi:hypothetical protein